MWALIICLEAILIRFIWRLAAGKVNGDVDCGRCLTAYHAFCISILLLCLGCFHFTLSTALSVVTVPLHLMLGSHHTRTAFILPVIATVGYFGRHLIVECYTSLLSDWQRVSKLRFLRFVSMIALGRLLVIHLPSRSGGTHDTLHHPKNPMPCLYLDLEAIDSGGEDGLCFYCRSLLLEKMLYYESPKIFANYFLKKIWNTVQSPYELDSAVKSRLKLEITRIVSSVLTIDKYTYSILDRRRYYNGCEC